MAVILRDSFEKTPKQTETHLEEGNEKQQVPKILPILDGFNFSSLNIAASNGFRAIGPFRIRFECRNL